MTRRAVLYLPRGADADSPAPVSLPDGIEVVTALTHEEYQRTGLAQCLQRIAGGEAELLYVARLSDIAGSFGELLWLLEWLEAADAGLIAADVGLDTGDSAGRRSVALLREIERWGRQGGPARRPRGRPGLSAGSPELAQRIAQLRERGLSLGAIAETLNTDGVPTPRGGALWRPSSVQAALGYRRPRPPAPGAPPPPGRPAEGKRPGPSPRDPKAEHGASEPERSPGKPGHRKPKPKRRPPQP